MIKIDWYLSELWQIMCKKEYNSNISAFVGIIVWMYSVFSKCITSVVLYDLYDRYLHECSTLDVTVFGHIYVIWPKECSPKVWHIAAGTHCVISAIYMALLIIWEIYRYVIGVRV